MTIARQCPFPLVVLMLVALLGVFGAGCADVSEDAYERIEIGMHIDDVRNIIGTDGRAEEVRGTSISAAGVAGRTPSAHRDQVHTWTSGQRKIVVHTRNGLVTEKFKMGF